MSPEPISTLRADDLAQLRSLLQANDLPGTDCDVDKHIYLGLFDGPRLIAAGGLEPAGDCVLLRSLVVAPDHRGAGLAAAITRELIERAVTRGARAIYLLTETAADYFPRFGFHSVDRSGVPAEIAVTPQFAELCPDTARCLCLELKPD